MAFDANTMFLCHWNGVDAATTATDVGPSGHSITFEGDAQIDTAQSKFGGASLYVDGNDHCWCAYSTDWNFGSGEFTIEAWVRQASLSGNDTIISQWTDGNRGWSLSWDTTPKIYFGYSTNGSDSTWISATSTWSNNTWMQAVALRTGTTCKIFRNGVQVGTDVAMSATIYDSTDRMRHGVGKAGAEDFWLGWIDETRISDIARWTTDFTPETDEYTDAVARNRFMMCC